MMDAVVDTFREGAGFSENVTGAVVTSLALNEWGADFELHECYVLAFFCVLVVSITHYFLLVVLSVRDH